MTLTSATEGRPRRPHRRRPGPAGIPARASRLAAWRELVRQAPPAVLADTLGVSPGTAMRHAFLGGADWSAYAAYQRGLTSSDETSRQAADVDRNLPTCNHQELP